MTADTIWNAAIAAYLSNDAHLTGVKGKHMSKLAHSNQETMDQIKRDAEHQQEPPSWWCDPCRTEVYALRCPYCDKAKEEKT